MFKAIAKRAVEAVLTAVSGDYACRLLGRFTVVYAGGPSSLMEGEWEAGGVWHGWIGAWEVFYQLPGRNVPRFHVECDRLGLTVSC